MPVPVAWGAEAHWVRGTRGLRLLRAWAVHTAHSVAMFEVQDRLRAALHLHRPDACIGVGGAGDEVLGAGREGHAGHIVRVVDELEHLLASEHDHPATQVRSRRCSISQALEMPRRARQVMSL